MAKWRGLPQELRAHDVEKWEVHRIANREWTAFLNQFAVVWLGYAGVDLAKIMNWYDEIAAPFGLGEKRKEFPDAFVLAMLEEYAVTEKVYVAVVSADPDFKLACERYNCLLHFESLPPLTELMLSDDARLKRYRGAIDGSIDVLYEAVAQ